MGKTQLDITRMVEKNQQQTNNLSKTIIGLESNNGEDGNNPESNPLPPINKTKKDGTDPTSSNTNDKNKAAMKPPPQGNSLEKYGAEKLGDLKNIKNLFKPYKGDVFSTGGDNSDGLLYLSRMNVASDPKKKDEEEREKLRRELEKANSIDLANLSNNERKLSKSVEVKNLHLRDKKRRFAISLATLASKPGKREQIVKQGCIETLVNLAKLQDRQT